MSALPFDPQTAGVDEAGRGPIAGPLVVAAVLLPPGFDATGLDDSKKLTAPRRETLYQTLVAQVSYHIQIVPPQEIDRLNIYQATLAAMAQCLQILAPPQALIDGNALPKNCPCPTQALVKGDSKNAAIAAASILAKVTRDNLMVEADAKYPGYNFASNKGYGTDAIARLRELGPTPLHRRSFEPLKSILSQPCLTLDI